MRQTPAHARWRRNARHLGSDALVSARARRRLRRVVALLANARGVAAFAGGYVAAVRVAARMLWERGLGAAAGWAASATAQGRLLRPAGYRRWLKRRPPPAGELPVLAVASTLDLPVAARPAYLALLRERAAAGVAIAVVTDAPLEGQVGDCRLVSTPTLTVDVWVAAARRLGADCEWILLLQPGCVPALAGAPESINGADAMTLYYGDEDRMDAGGRRSRPNLKPGFSPDLLCATDYFGSLLAPRALLQALDSAAVGDAHSLALRLVELAADVERVPRVLAHRFHAPTPTVAPPIRLETFLRRRYGDGARVRATKGAGAPWRCEFGNRGRVSVVVPTRDRLTLLRRCVEGVFRTNRGAFEVLVLDNDSRDPRTLEWLERAAATWPNLRVVPAPGEFNWSRINNIGVDHAEGDVLVFLNNDTEPLCQNWLARMADVALRPDVGAVGALLLYASGRIQHAGVVVGSGATTDHVYRGARPDLERRVFVSPLLPRNVAAVTGACMAFARRTLEGIGRFDERYPVAGNDVEICVRAWTKGLVNVYLPDVALRHLESRTRGRRDPTADVRRLQAFLAARCPLDPYYHPALTALP